MKTLIPRSRAGRPMMAPGQARNAVLSVRLTAAERAAVEAKAGAAGVSASDWAREALVAALAGSGRGEKSAKSKSD